MAACHSTYWFLWCSTLVLLFSSGEAKRRRKASDNWSTPIRGRQEIFPQKEGEGEDRDQGPPRPMQARYAHRSTRPLNLLFFLSPLPYREGGGISEALWIRDIILSLIDRPIVVSVVEADDRMKTFMDDCLIVILPLLSFTPEVGIKDYLAKAREKGVKNIGIYHMGDEKYRGDLGWYPMVDYVFRNYYAADHHRKYPNCYWLPGGVRSGGGGHAGFIPSTMPLASQREHTCNFVGSLRMDRGEMMAALKNNNISCFIKVVIWESQTMQHPILYRLMLESSRFTLCPWGNNPDTMRFYEALEVGSIPIVRYPAPRKDKDPHIILGDSPIPKLKEWAELPGILEQYADKAKVDRLQKEVITWWQGRRHRLFQMVANIIQNSFKKHHPEEE